MKKIITFLIIVAIIIGFVSCSGLLDGLSLKTQDTKKCEDCSIKLSTSESMAGTYYVTPEGFDYDKLEKSGYKSMTITVSYDVYYEKDWSLGFGYLGSPKYEISLVNSDGLGNIEANLETTSASQSKTFTSTAQLVDLKDTRLVLTFSTDNIQNVIYFKNIKIKYKCNK